MAAITVAAKGAGATMAAANGGGDTVAAVQGKYGGHVTEGAVALIVTVGATPTVVTIDGTAQTSLTSKTATYVVNPGTYGRTVAVAYDQVTGVTVGAQVL